MGIALPGAVASIADSSTVHSSGDTVVCLDILFFCAPAFIFCVRVDLLIFTLFWTKDDLLARFNKLKSGSRVKAEVTPATVSVRILPFFCSPVLYHPCLGGLSLRTFISIRCDSFTWDRSMRIKSASYISSRAAQRGHCWCVCGFEKKRKRCSWKN